MPFGVELPDTFAQPPSGDTPSQSSDSGSAPAGSANTVESVAPNGAAKATEPRANTSDSLEALFAEPKQSDDPNAKFDKAFRYDFKTVLEDPSKLTEFRRIYPPEYVQIVEAALKKANTLPQQPTEGSAKPWKDDPEFQEIIQFRKQFEAAQREQRLQHINSQLDKSFDKFTKKYPEADPNVINWWMQGLSQRGIEMMNKDANGTPTTVKDQILEKLFKQDHERREEHYQQKYKAIVEAQKSANGKARDMGVGGSPSSPAGKQPKTIRSATQSLLADLASSR